MRISALIAIPLVFMSSCINQFSDNPVDAPPGTGADVSPFLGNWQLMSVGTYTPTNQLIVRVSTGQVGSVVATFITAAESNDHTVVLTATNGIMLASVWRDATSWNIYKISTDAQRTMLYVSLPDPSIVSNDVKNGVLSGEVLASEERDCSIHLKATSSQLPTYFSTRTNGFSQPMVFQKQ